MKTRLIILAIAGSVLLFSCTNDRNEDEQLKTVPVLKSEEEKIEINNVGGYTSKESDSIIGDPSLSGDIIFSENLDPSEGGDPKDVPPRK